MLALTSMLSVATQEFRYRRYRRALFSLLCEQPIATPLCSSRRCRGKPFSMEGRVPAKGNIQQQERFVEQRVSVDDGSENLLLVFLLHQ